MDSAEQENHSPSETKPLTSSHSASDRIRNFWLLVLYQVVLRTGWIFKTESIVMPAILDAIGGTGLLRGFLPMLNRLGQSVPPILLAERLRVLERKKIPLFICVLLMGICFLALADVWALTGESVPGWLPYLFLLIYGAFWFFVGIHNLCLSLIYGKLVVPNQRGRLMFVAMIIGCGTAIFSAYFLMKPWLATGNANFIYLFLFTGICFVFSSLFAVFLSESRDELDAQPRSFRESIGESWSILNNDKNFGYLAVIASCYGISITLFPHYQAFVRENSGVGIGELVAWVIIQNIGAATFSIPLGRVADRFGNRMALRITMFLLCIAPLLAVIWSWWGADHSEIVFHVIFFLLGLTPVSMRMFNNYTLEIAGQEYQPVYLSTLGGCMAVPVILFSAAVGWLVDQIGFEYVYSAIVAILFLGWVLTFRLVEPRSENAEPKRTGPQSTVLN